LIAATNITGAMPGVPFWISGITIHHFRNIAGPLVQSRRMGNYERALSILCPMMNVRCYLFREGVPLMRTVLQQRDGVGTLTPKVQEEVSQTEESATSNSPPKAFPHMCITGRTYSPCS